MFFGTGFGSCAFVIDVRAPKRKHSPENSGVALEFLVNKSIVDVSIFLYCETDGVLA